MKRGLAGLLSLALLLCACGGREQPLPRYEATFLTLFDTVTTIVGYNESREAFTAQAQALHDDLEEYHRLYDIYHTYEGINNLKTVNDQAGIAPVRVDQRIIDLLLVARELYGRTDGKVNIAFGSVLGIWHDYREQGIDDPENAALPPMEQLRQAAEHTDIGRMTIDEAASTVFLEDAQMRLDVGAIAKGYATQRVCENAKKRGVESLLVSVGGNVCAIGTMDGKKAPWRVGVQNPDGESPEKYLHKVGLNDQSLVTSGSYQRYYTVKGQEYHHIIDPETLMPAAYFTAVSVVAADSGVADALSTALFNMPYEAGLALVEQLEDPQVLWVLPDGTEKQSAGFQKLLIDTADFSA